MKPVILIVDDSRVMRMALKKMLRADFDLLEASDGEDGWNKLEKNPSITAVFSDLSMPVLDGFGLMARVRSSDQEWISKIPFIVITGNEEDDGIREQAMQCGATDFITKPFRSSEIMERANKYVLHATGESSESPIVTSQETVPLQSLEQPAENITSSATITPATSGSSVDDMLHQQSNEHDTAEAEARKFAERETSRMHEHLLARQQAEEEAAAKAATEKRKRDEVNKEEKERAIRKALLEQQAKVQDDIEFAPMGDLTVTEPVPQQPRQSNNLHASEADKLHVEETRFAAWKQDVTSDEKADLGRIRRDSSLQAELNEALKIALNETQQHDSSTDFAAQSQNQPFTLEELTTPEEPGAAAQPGIESSSSIKLEPLLTARRTHEFPGMHKQDSTPAHTDHGEQKHQDFVLQLDKQDFGFVEQTTTSTVDTAVSEVEDRQRVQETAKIKERLEKLKEVEIVDELGGYSLLTSLFVRLYLPVLKVANKYLGIGDKYEIKLMQQRLDK